MGGVAMGRVAMGRARGGGRGGAVGGGVARGLGARWCGAAAGVTAAGILRGSVHGSLGAPVPACAGSGCCEKTVRKATPQLFRLAENSRAAASGGRYSRNIRKDIIGRGMAVPRLGFAAAGNGFRFRDLPSEILGMIEEQASQAGCGVFLEPGIEQLRELLLKVGSVAQSRQLQALQRITRRGEKELPRRLGVIQRDLPRKYPAQNKRLVMSVKLQGISTACGFVWK